MIKLYTPTEWEEAFNRAPFMEALNRKYTAELFTFFRLSTGEYAVIDPYGRHLLAVCSTLEEIEQCPNKVERPRPTPRHEPDLPDLDLDLEIDL